MDKKLGKAMSDYDLVVVGGGLAGLTAGMVGSRCGLRVAIIERAAPGGQVLNVTNIENFPGFPQGIGGYDLGPILQEQAEMAGADFLLDSVLSIDVASRDKVVTCAENEVRGKTVIIAIGSSLRRLGICGEETLLGKGVSHCASCDGPFFVGREVCVVGGGDSALEEAAVLTDYAAKVRVFHRGATLRAQRAIEEKARSKVNLEVVFNTQVLEVLGSEAVSGVRLRNVNTGEELVEELAGVFIFVGLDPNTSFLQDVLDLDAGGHIVTDVLMRTSVEGVFAAGDVRQGSVAQVASVVGDGATAAMSAWRYLA